MAALWLHTFSLLVLLLLTVPAVQPGASPRHLCGSDLVEALYLVCEGGFHTNSVRDTDSLLEMVSEKRSAYHPYQEMVKREGIVEQCCHRPCATSVLENYCN